MDMVMRRMATLPMLARERPSGWRWMTEGAQQHNGIRMAMGSSMPSISVRTKHRGRAWVSHQVAHRRRWSQTTVCSPHFLSPPSHSEQREAEFSSWSSLSSCSAYERERTTRRIGMGMTTRRTKTRRTNRLSHSSIEIHDEHQNQHLAPRRRFAVQPMDPWPVRQLDPRSSRPVDQPRPLLRGVRLNTPTHRTGLR